MEHPTSVAEPQAQFTCFPDLPVEIRRMIYNAALPGPRIVHLRQEPLNRTIKQWEKETGREWPPLEDDTEGSKGLDGRDLKRMSEVENEEESESDSEDTGSEVDATEVDLTIDASERSRMQHDLMAAMEHAGGMPEKYNEAELVGLRSEAPNPALLFVSHESRNFVIESYTCAFHCTAAIPCVYFNFDIDTLYLRRDAYSTYYIGAGADPLVDALKLFRIHDMDNIRKVKKLALFLDESDPHSGRAFPDVLEYFQGVEELTIVETHFEQDNRVGNDPELVLIKPIKAVDMMMHYGIFGTIEHVADWGDADDPDLPAFEALPNSVAKVRYDQIASCRAEDVEANGAVTWTMPSVMTAAMIAECMLDEMVEGLGNNLLAVDDMRKRVKSKEQWPRRMRNTQQKRVMKVTMDWLLEIERVDM